MTAATAEAYPEALAGAIVVEGVLLLGVGVVRPVILTGMAGGGLEGTAGAGLAGRTGIGLATGPGAGAGVTGIGFMIVVGGIEVGS